MVRELTAVESPRVSPGAGAAGVLLVGEPGEAAVDGGLGVGRDGVGLGGAARGEVDGIARVSAARRRTPWKGVARRRGRGGNGG